MRLLAEQERGWPEFQNLMEQWWGHIQKENRKKSGRHYHEEMQRKKAVKEKSLERRKRDAVKFVIANDMDAMVGLGRYKRDVADRKQLQRKNAAGFKKMGIF